MSSLIKRTRIEFYLLIVWVFRERKIKEAYPRRHGRAINLLIQKRIEKQGERRDNQIKMFYHLSQQRWKIQNFQQKCCSSQHKRWPCKIYLIFETVTPIYCNKKLKLNGRAIYKSRITQTSYSLLCRGDLYSFLCFNNSSWIFQHLQVSDSIGAVQDLDIASFILHYSSNILYCAVSFILVVFKNL